MQLQQKQHVESLNANAWSFLVHQCWWKSGRTRRVPVWS